ncbi:dienelactone hydrolase family protein [Desulfovibrio sp. JC022]|uniref:dienelactone hydrolase family protein n=1 Tax=Desulfovibrio sp. JC022 TaxID=2593642 RepID=UPI0013D07FFA|nr:dienelactone hydrolase family protein [Desulfovibrio sp. JC022]NDV24183.1 dienelactone hydrolase family protein [Desulfovibrio sp. JC022]
MHEQRSISHIHLNIEFESVLLLPEGQGPFPAVLLFHEYTGLNEVIISHARRLARNGYAVLAADFYGVHNRPSTIDEARTTHRIYRNDRLLMREGAKACLDVLRGQPEVGSSCIYTLGFSFGGGVALELARSGAELKGAVSVYGYLDTTHLASPGDMKCPLLAIHVNNDPVVPAEHLRMFEEEMDYAKVDYDLTRLDNAQHGFANSDDDGFDARLAEKMWAQVLDWLDGKK